MTERLKTVWNKLWGLKKHEKKHGDTIRLAVSKLFDECADYRHSKYIQCSVVFPFLEDPCGSHRSGCTDKELNAMLVNFDGDFIDPSISFPISLGQLASFPPTRLRNLKKCFRDDMVRREYILRGKPLDLLYNNTGGVRGMYAPFFNGNLLVEHNGVGWKKADPTLLITARPDYKRKKDGKYITKTI